jgi:ABC-2 type transport system permease protein
MNLLLVEMRRGLHRRVVWVLVALALCGCALAGVIAFFTSSDASVTELRFEGHPAIMAEWWRADGEGSLLIASFFLLLGGLFGGASVAGAEWRAGTVTTVLTWEPRRSRLHLARTAACTVLAALIAFALQALFLASFLPAVLAHGSTAGTDADWWVELTVAMARTSLITALAAMMGVALATIGRNTAFALVAAFAWVAVIEPLIRQLKPTTTQYLWGENVNGAMTWVTTEGPDYTRGPLAALVTITLYSAVLVGAALIAFRRRDIAGAS